jgi:hypothetical protein
MRKGLGGNDAIIDARASAMNFKVYELCRRLDDPDKRERERILT